MLELLYKSLPVIVAIIFMVIFFGHNKSIWDNYWHLGLSVLFAAASLITLHYGKEEKASRATQDIEIATNALKTETDKITRTLRYSTVAFKMKIKFDVEPTFDNNYRAIPKYFSKYGEYELTIKDSQGKSSVYELSDKEIIIDDIQLNPNVYMRNYIYVPRMITHDPYVSFTMYLNFELLSDLSINFVELNEKGSLELLFREIPNSEPNSERIKGLIRKKMSLAEHGNIRFTNDGEWTLFDYEKCNPIDGADDLGYDGFSFKFKKS